MPRIPTQHTLHFLCYFRRVSGRWVLTSQLEGAVVEICAVASQFDLVSRVTS